MSSEVFVDFTGRAKLSPRTVLKYTGSNPDKTSRISVDNWLKLSEEERQDYTIDNFAYAISRSEECECSVVNLSVS